MVDHVVLRRTRLGGKQKLVEAVIHARDFTRLLAAHELDTFHGRREPLVVAQIATQTHEILGEAHGDGSGFFAWSSAGPLWRPPRCAASENPRAGNWFENFADAFEILARDQGPFELLQVNGRTEIAVDVAQLVAGEHVDQQSALFEPGQPGVQPALARLRELPRPASAAQFESKRRRAFSGSLR